jgi:hypothetical protein
VQERNCRSTSGSAGGAAVIAGPPARQANATSNVKAQRLTMMDAANVAEITGSTNRL